MRLKGKNAIVTGGAKGIGEAIVRIFLQEGANVLIADMAEEGAVLADKLNEIGQGRCVFCRTDVTVPENVKNAVSTAADIFGGIDILINDAGTVERDTLLEDMPEEVWFKVLNVNLNGAFLCTKYALPYLRESRGCVVSMSSTSGLVATRNDPAYCASKTGIIGMTRSVACDYGKFGVRANAVCPTICETPLFNSYINSFTPEEKKEKMERLGGPGGRPCTCEEIARTVLFLASSEASYVSGTAVTVDGGYCIV